MRRSCCAAWVAVGLLAAASAAAQTAITWDTGATDWRGQNGRALTFVCPAGGPAAPRLWGSDLYTDDSSICGAAAHAGVITRSDGGTVTIEIRPGAPAYSASTRHGVASGDWGAYDGSFAVVGGRAAGAGDPRQATWTTTATALRGRNGERFAFACPGGGTAPGPVWGTDLYTDDSSLCAAAVHAGLIGAAAGGTVTVEVRPGAASYRGSARNGVTSQDYGQFAGSFAVVKGSDPAAATGTVVRADWGTTAAAYRGRNGVRVTFSCPPGGAPGSVWGTDLYTDDSSVCTAAAHAGVITAAKGGTVTVEVRPGAPSYVGTSRNGVDSRDYGAWSGSFALVPPR